MADFNTISILLDHYSEKEVFGRLPDPSEDYAALEVVLTDEKTLTAFKRYHINLIAMFENVQRDRFLGNIHHSIVAEWEKKGPAAIAHLAGQGTDPILTLEAEVTGESVGDLAAIIAPRYQTYMSIGPKITGLRRKVAAAIKAAASPEIVVATYNAARQQAQAEADQIAQALGVE